MTHPFSVFSPFPFALFPPSPLPRTPPSLFLSLLPHRLLYPSLPRPSQKSSFAPPPSFAPRTFSPVALSLSPLFPSPPYTLSLRSSLARVPLISGVSHCLKGPSVPRLFHPPLSSLRCTRAHKERLLLSAVRHPLLSLHPFSLLSFVVSVQPESTPARCSFLLARDFQDRASSLPSLLLRYPLPSLATSLTLITPVIRCEAKKPPGSVNARLCSKRATVFRDLPTRGLRTCSQRGGEHSLPARYPPADTGPNAA